MRKIAVTRVEIISAFKVGCILGALLCFVPGIFLALATRVGVSSLRALLESWQNVELGGAFGQTLRVDVVALLKLDDLLKILQNLNNSAWLVAIGIVLGAILLGGGATALVSGIVAGIYNLTARLSGGIEIVLGEQAADCTPAVIVGARAWLVGPGLPPGGIALHQNVMRLGRDPTNQIVLASPAVAPFHAEIVKMGEHWIVRDLGSPTGTCVNGRRIQENMLKDGFRVRFGDTELTFHQMH